MSVDLADKKGQRGAVDQSGIENLRGDKLRGKRIVV